MEKVLSLVVLLGCASTPALANDGPSGSISVVSDYKDDAGWDYTGPGNEGVLQGSLSLPVPTFGDGFTLEAWGNKGRTRNGDELDLGVHKTQEIAKGVSVNAGVDRYFLRGVPDIWVFSAGVQAGPIEVEVKRYAWRLEDATRFKGKVALPTKGIDTKLVGVYETGWGERDIALVGVEASFPLDDHWSIDAMAMTPIKRHRYDATDPTDWKDPRGTVATIGLTYSF